MVEDLQAKMPGLPDLDDATVAVRDFIGASRDLVVRMARVMGMNANDMAAIAMLTFEGAMGSTELAGRLGISTASATALVDRLESGGMIERVRDTHDRRRVTLTETGAARATSLEAWLPAIMRMDEICRTLSESERAFTIDLLARLQTAMDAAAR
ncbi:MarR family transcriptional regulator [Actinoplanes bogorensis]|uniref:MarR family transcriptional regulator n=1 Tax=Paractinoplanes bogorensis TaxID=1610840 RepID=A0ABS5YW58_9ACTN|nr:MarR family transcriptional regulator [Actinoplanes bogorensis]MBU2666949.1 MarR family transcriptional regulator [Actinoplanes bogorensis]